MAFDISRRQLLGNAVLLGGATALLGACTSKGGASPSSTSVAGTSIEGYDVISDRSKFPTTFHERPEFAAQVAAGKLPPVDQRIGQDPLVIRAQSVGKYGGQIRMGMVSNDSDNADILAGPDSLLFFDHTGKTIIPNIALGYELSGDFKQLTLHLRNGMKWSDGHPFTADDLVFWRNDVNLDDDIGYQSGALTIGGENVTMEKVDDYTVLFTSPMPYSTLPDQLAGSSDVSGTYYNGQSVGGGFAPKHYLSQYLPKYTSEAEANKRAKAAGFDGWVSYLLNQNTWFYNPDLPTVMPWVITQSTQKDLAEFAANPYSIWVDTAGNQLPYVSQVSIANTQSSDVLALNCVSGQYDYQDRGLTVASLPVLISNQKRSDYTIHRAADDVMDCAVLLCLSYDGEMGDLIRTLEFRRALSLAIDREAVNDTYFLGTSVPSATMCSDQSIYYPGPGWRTKWATHDVQQANALLDGLGLTKRDSSGFRLLPSGKDRIRIEMQSTTKADFPTMGQMIVRHWAQIGVDAFSDVIDGALSTDRAKANQLMATVNNVYGVEEPFLGPNGFLPVVYGGTVASTMGYKYSQWFITGGAKGEEPPDSLKTLKDAVTQYNTGVSLPREKRIDLGKQLFRTHADQVWTIGVVGMGLQDYGMYYTKNSIQNVPATIHNSDQTNNTSLVMPMAFYYNQ